MKLNHKKTTRNLIKNKNILYPLILLLIVLILAILNYEPNTWLTGWDNIHPEFDFQINLERHFTASWQEYQGLGLPAAMGHASDAPRILILIILDIFLPTNLVRYGYMFLMLFWGSVGTFSLLKWLLTRASESKKKGKITLSIKQINLFTFLGSLYFIFNLGTLQQFYTPISMFPTQWAYLPWLFLYFFKIIKNPIRTNYIKFATLSIFAAPMSYTPTLFVVYAFAIGVISLITLINAYQNKKFKVYFQRILAAGLLIIAMNSFWLFSFIHFFFNSGSSTVIDSKMNQMFSLDSYAQNRAAGKLENVVLLRGFWFDNQDYYEESNTFDVLMRNWDNHINQPIIQFVGLVFFIIILTGIIYSIFKRIPHKKSLIILFFSSVFVLLNSNPPFGFLFDFLREISPIFKESLRFPFTKFSPLATLLYSIFFTIGIIAIYKIIQSKIKPNLLNLVAIGVLFGLSLMNIPMLSGQLINPGLTQEIPEEYFEIFEYFKNQPQELRIANLPQDRFWAWYHYYWGYRGSGFLWYGVRQPVLDRAFDVWSYNNEQYYNEISYAIYNENYNQIENIMKKYHIGWIFYDPNMRLLDAEAGKQEAFYNDTFIPNLINRSSFKLAGDFNNLKIIEYTPNIDSPDFLKTSASNKALAEPINKQYKDDIYNKSNDYIYSEELDANTQYLFSDVNTIEQNIEISDKTISIQANSLINGNLTIPSTADQESHSILNVKEISNLFVFSLITPKIYVNNILQNSQTSHINKNFNTDKIFVASTIDLLETNNRNTNLAIDNKNSSLDIFNANPSLYKNLKNDYLEDLSQYSGNCSTEPYKSKTFSVAKKGNDISLESKNASACIYKRLQTVNQKSLIEINYTYEAQTDNTGLRICALTEQEKCLEPLKIREKITNTLGYQTYFFEINPYETINLHTILDAADEKKNLLIKDISIKYYNFKESFSFPLKNIGQISTYKINQGDSIKIQYPVSNSSLFTHEINSNDILKSGFNYCQFQKDLSINQVTKTNDGVKITSKDTEICNQFQYPNLPIDNNYVVSVQTRFIKNYPLRFCIANYKYNNCNLEFLSGENEEFESKNYVIPRISNSGKGYNLNISSRSRGDFSSINEIKSIGIYYFPLELLKNIQVSNDSISPIRNNLELSNYNRTYPFLYQAEVEGTGLLNLQQSYNNGWTLIGANEAKHVLVNNWSNGWIIDTKDKSQKITIIYLPQILEFIGFSMTIFLVYGLYLAVTYEMFKKKK